MSIATNLYQIHQQIIAAAKQYNRLPQQISTLAVSKGHTSEQILQALAAGQHAFAESYLQEAVSKINELCGYNLEWHFIGAIQSNKTKIIAEKFSWVHTVDREIIAQRLNDQRPTNFPPLNICLQVNISHEVTKSGVALDLVADLATKINKLPRLKLRGLMTIPKATNNFMEQRNYFHLLKEAQLHLNDQYGMQMDTLSMGMSNDFIAAIAEGATIIRIGTAIFGARIK